MFRRKGRAMEETGESKEQGKPGRPATGRSTVSLCLRLPKELKDKADLYDIDIYQTAREAIEKAVLILHGKEKR